jgi:hypothetical protein
MENNSINVGGDFIGTAAAGNTGGKISAEVSSAIIPQLPSSPDSEKLGIRELLLRLEEAIEEDTELLPEDKVDLLEQVKVFVEAKQTLETHKKEGLVRRAKKVFDATLRSLPDTAKIVEASSKLLPLILKFLGYSNST